MLLLCIYHHCRHHHQQQQQQNMLGQISEKKRENDRVNANAKYLTHF